MIVAKNGDALARSIRGAREQFRNSGHDQFLCLITLGDGVSKGDVT
jgi:hypothetical protein